MKNITIVAKGHSYELHHHEGEGVETVNFIQKEATDPESEVLQTVQQGTTNEAVIEMVIDRLQFLNHIMHSEYNDKAISDLEGALAALNARTTERESREVEGTDKE